MHRKTSKQKKRMRKFTLSIAKLTSQPASLSIPNGFLYVCISGKKICDNDSCYFFHKPDEQLIKNNRASNCPITVEEVKSRLLWVHGQSVEKTEKKYFNHIKK